MATVTPGSIVSDLRPEDRSYVFMVAAAVVGSCGDCVYGLAVTVSSSRGISVGDVWAWDLSKRAWIPT